MLLETAVAAVVAGTAVCSDYFSNETRFNPTELSDYQKCVYQAHDTNSGTVGGNFWFKSGDNYVYVPLNELQGQTRDAVKNTLVQAVIVQALNDEIDGLRTKIEALETAQELLETDMQSQIDKLQGKLDGIKVYQDTIAAGTITVDIGSGRVDLNNEQLHDIDHTNMSYPAENGLINASPNNAGDFWIVHDGNVSYQIQITGETGQAHEVLLADILETLDDEALMQAAFKAGYTYGYDNGYTDGYEAGYADGFKDGVASVTQ